MFGVVVNYFSNKSFPLKIKQSAKFALSLLLNCEDVSSVVLSDGSNEPDEEMKNYCESLMIKYVHQGKKTNFGESFNYGVSFLEEEWIALMNSDIYVYPDTFLQFHRFIERHSNLNIGCLIPYLAKSDFPLQANSIRRNAYASLMTYNLNIFKKEVLARIGGVSTDFSGCFNDVDACIKLKRLGLDVYIVGHAYALHYGRLTIDTCGQEFLDDEKVFLSKYPQLYDKNGFWYLKTDKFLRSGFLKLLFYLVRCFSSKLSNCWNDRLYNSLFMLVPYFQKIK